MQGRVRMMALVAGQDVEPAEDSDGTDGRWRIARKVAHDRVISTVDPETRHTRTSKSHRKDGYRGHVAAEPETGLITDCELTTASGDAGSDPVVGEGDDLPRPLPPDQHPDQGQGARARRRGAGTHRPRADHRGWARYRQAHHRRARCGRARSGRARAERAAPSRPARAGDEPDATAVGTEPARDQHDDDRDTDTDTDTDADAPGQGQGQGLAVYGDSAYGTGQARARYREAGHDTVIKPKPLRPAVPGGFAPRRLHHRRGQRRRHLPRRAHPGHESEADGDLRQGMRRLPVATTVHHRRRGPLDDPPPPRGTAARQPRPRPHPEFTQAHPTRCTVERIIAWTATRTGRRITLRYIGVTKNDAWFPTRRAAINLRTLTTRGLTRHNTACALA
jgi:hypothetical protein